MPVYTYEIIQREQYKFKETERNCRYVMALYTNLTVVMVVVVLLSVNQSINQSKKVQIKATFA